MRDIFGSGLPRRDFLRISSACGAHIAWLAAAAPARALSVFAMRRGRVVAQEPWGRLEEVADGVWAMISTPLQDRTTLCNGGIIRGSAGVVVVESFASPDGAAWLAGRARALTGRWPDAVVLTHYHGDHTGGIEGFAREDGAPAIHVTSATRELVAGQDARRDSVPPTRTRLLADGTMVDAAAPSTIDLGDRSVRISPREGHTRSDLTLEIDDPSVVFCGDLVWNAMFPNYVDAIPSRLGRDVRALERTRETAYVPGHGPLADAQDLTRYIALLDSIETIAREAHERGETAAGAAARYTVPPSLGEWMMFSPRYPETAITAWLRELSG